jgi:hypothetical protein
MQNIFMAPLITFKFSDSMVLSSKCAALSNGSERLTELRDDVKGIAEFLVFPLLAEAIFISTLLSVLF